MNRQMSLKEGSITLTSKSTSAVTKLFVAFASDSYIQITIVQLIYDAHGKNMFLFRVQKKTIGFFSELRYRRTAIDCESTLKGWFF